jgi:hypothetical protein
MAVTRIGNPAALREVFEMKPSEVKQAARIVEATRQRCLERWEESHG